MVQLCFLPFPLKNSKTKVLIKKQKQTKTLGKKQKALKN